MHSRSPSRLRLAASIATLAVTLAAPVASLATEATVYVEPPPRPDAVSIVADFLIARPLGLVATVVGSTFYVVAFPFAALAGDIHTPAEILVGEPARFTFNRPLGQVDL